MCLVLALRNIGDLRYASAHTWLGSTDNTVSQDITQICSFPSCTPYSCIQNSYTPASEGRILYRLRVRKKAAVFKSRRIGTWRTGLVNLFTRKSLHYRLGRWRERKRQKKEDRKGPPPAMALCALMYLLYIACLTVGDRKNRRRTMIPRNTTTLLGMWMRRQYWFAGSISSNSCSLHLAGLDTAWKRQGDVLKMRTMYMNNLTM
ncbi:uncharacterized protein F4812DRAFT_162031 [Daldinia caldariorum]|uniref:uncharacterized protein n=1 Tax=Daldinia caldariorum TaxID=326644 RepID=UPI00200767EF|nr:uncharacterized protein F4812DRAFT_162031 [Daldinia caldariorum]KAI1470996.1 hypothetical protein F4812DRAFT_162031 [Daldinia caldariorum]